MNTGSSLPILSKSARTRALVIGLRITVILLAFEVFNFSSTEYALNDILGDGSFWGLRWCTFWAAIFCAFDFYFIVQLFKREKEHEDASAVWVLFAFWLLIAALNSILTWWGVSVGMLNNASTSIKSDSSLMRIFPIFVAGTILLVRVLLINSISYAVDQLRTNVTGVVPGK